MLAFRPFSEPILNLTNSLCEVCVLMIFFLIGISLTKHDELLIERLDSALVFIVNFIMYVQMSSSILVFIKNLIKKFRANRNKVVPLTTCKHAFTDFTTPKH